MCLPVLITIWIFSYWLTPQNAILGRLTCLYSSIYSTYTWHLIYPFKKSLYTIEDHGSTFKIVYYMYRCVSFFLDTININSDINAFFPLHDNPQLSIKSCSKYWLYFWHLNLRLQITNIYDNRNVWYIFIFFLWRGYCAVSQVLEKKRSIIIHIFPFLLNNHFWLDDLLWWVRYFCRW